MRRAGAGPLFAKYILIAVIRTTAARRPPLSISTMNDLPGYDIEEVCGEVFGLTVRSRNVGVSASVGLLR
jgi:Putative heavy-metal-binding